MAITLFLLLGVVFASAYVPLIRAPVHEDVLEGRYIVVFKDDVSEEDFAAELDFATKNYEVLHQYKYTIKGYAARLNPGQLKAVRQSQVVSWIEEDALAHATACSNPVAVNTWGLTRIAEAKMSLDGFYRYPTTGGQGVIAYILDTGIYIQHTDFSGRATFGWKAEPGWSDTDGNGHGTHVASTTVGAAYGVARSATTIGVKVLGDNGSGSWAGVIGGVDWTIGQYVGHKKPSVINMSLGGGFNAAVNAAVDAAVNAGVVVAVAAGNSNNDACGLSPAGADEVLTVGSTDIGVAETDIRSYFSSYGPCVEVFAPGSDITAAWIGSPTAIRTISGTSMASPHVAGVACLMRGEVPHAPARDIQNSLISSATQGEINLQCPPSGTCNQSPNLMVWNGCTK